MKSSPVDRIIGGIRADQAKAGKTRRVQREKSQREIGKAVQACMPDGRPAPFVMTAEDVCAFLRLDGTPSLRRLQRLRANGLEARQMGDYTRFLLPDVVAFATAAAAPRARGRSARRGV